MVGLLSVEGGQGDDEMSKRSWGRPTVPPEKLRGNRITTFLTDAEFAVLKARAAARDLPRSAIAYQILSRALKRRK